MSEVARFVMKVIRKIDDPLHKMHLVGDHWWQAPGRMICDLYDWDVGGPPAKWMEPYLERLVKLLYG